MKIKVGNNWYDTRTTEIECSPALGHTHDGPNTGTVKSASINGGDPILPDEHGNIDLPFAAVTGEGLSSDLTATITVGGVPVNYTFKAGTSIEEVLRKILIKEIKPTLSISLNPPAGVFHKGDTVTLKSVSYTVSKGSAAALASLTVTDGKDKLVDIVDVKSETKQVTGKSYTENTTFTGTLSYTDKSGEYGSIKAEAKYTFLDYSYMGAIQLGIPVDEISEYFEDNKPKMESMLTAENIKKLTTKLLATSANEFSYTTGVGEFMVYAYPASYGALGSIWDSNYKLDGFESHVKTVNIDGVDYKVYYSDIAELSNYKVQFRS